MKTSDFEYTLPQSLIAQTPIEDRAQSRLLVMDRSDGSLQHHTFFELVDLLHNGDVLVINDSRVIPARISGRRTGTGGKIEILLLRRIGSGQWETLVKPAKRIRVGDTIEVTDNRNPGISGTGSFAEVVEAGDSGMRVVRFSNESALFQLGQVALPPYIHTPLENTSRYQTVYANEDGSVAAPTAGLHFTQELMGKIKDKGVKFCSLTLHVGLDTFRPVQEDNPEEHRIHTEYGVLSREVADELNLAKQEGRRVICVGTTSVRLVEAAAHASDSQDIEPFQGWVNLFILPGYDFRLVDAMITNFHLPRSTLLMLVSAFAGKDLIMKAYKEAIEEEYRFYSFGDSMLIL